MVTQEGLAAAPSGAAAVVGIGTAAPMSPLIEQLALKLTISNKILQDLKEAYKKAQFDLFEAFEEIKIISAASAKHYEQRSAVIKEIEDERRVEVLKSWAKCGQLEIKRLLANQQVSIHINPFLTMVSENEKIFKQKSLITGELVDKLADIGRKLESHTAHILKFNDEYHQNLTRVELKRNEAKERLFDLENKLREAHQNHLATLNKLNETFAAITASAEKSAKEILTQLKKLDEEDFRARLEGLSTSGAEKSPAEAKAAALKEFNEIIMPRHQAAMKLATVMIRNFLVVSSEAISSSPESSTLPQSKALIPK